MIFVFLFLTSLCITDSESESEVAQLCPTLCNRCIVAYQAPLSMGFSRQEYWSGLPFPSPGDLPDPGIKPWSPAFQAEVLTSEPPGKALYHNLVSGQTTGREHSSTQKHKIGLKIY